MHHDHHALHLDQLSSYPQLLGSSARRPGLKKTLQDRYVLDEPLEADGVGGNNAPFVHPQRGDPGFAKALRAFAHLLSGLFFSFFANGSESSSMFTNIHIYILYIHIIYIYTHNIYIHIYLHFGIWSHRLWFSPARNWASTLLSSTATAERRCESARTSWNTTSSTVPVKKWKVPEVIDGRYWKIRFYAQHHPSFTCPLAELKSCTSISCCLDVRRSLPFSLQVADMAKEKLHKQLCQIWPSGSWATKSGDGASWSIKHKNQTNIKLAGLILKLSPISFSCLKTLPSARKKPSWATEIFEPRT